MLRRNLSSVFVGRRVRVPRWRGRRRRRRAADPRARARHRRRRRRRACSARPARSVLGRGDPRVVRGGRRAAGPDAADRRARSTPSAGVARRARRATGAALLAGERDVRRRRSRDHDAVLDAGALAPFAHWITPEPAPRRYDTWFFVAPAPDGHAYEHDDDETVASEWIRPADALDRARARRDRADLPDVPDPPGARRVPSAADAARRGRRRWRDRAEPLRGRRPRPGLGSSTSTPVADASRRRRASDARGPADGHRSARRVDVRGEELTDARPDARACRARCRRSCGASSRRTRVRSPGPGTNTYLVGIDEVAVIDPGPDDTGHIDAIVGASMKERVRWVLLTHTHPDHAPGTDAAREGDRRRGRSRSRKQRDKDGDVVPDRVDRRGRHDRGHRVRARGAAHAGPRARTTSASSSRRSACCSPATPCSTACARW